MSIKAKQNLALGSSTWTPGLSESSRLHAVVTLWQSLFVAASEDESCAGVCSAPESHAAVFVAGGAAVARTEEVVVTAVVALPCTNTNRNGDFLDMHSHLLLQFVKVVTKKFGGPQSTGVRHTNNPSFN